MATDDFFLCKGCDFEMKSDNLKLAIILNITLIFGAHFRKKKNPLNLFYVSFC